MEWLADETGPLLEPISKPFSPLLTLSCVKKSRPRGPYSEEPPRTEPFPPDQENIGRGTLERAKESQNETCKREGENGENARDGDIEADLASLDVLLKVPSGGATLGEGRSAVAVCSALRRKSGQKSPCGFRPRSPGEDSHLFRLMSLMASSRVSALTMTSTGPKISCLFEGSEGVDQSRTFPDDAGKRRRTGSSPCPWSLRGSSVRQSCPPRTRGP